MSARPRAVVVGGGISGLAAARALAAGGGVDVVVLEASDRVGGALAAVRVPGGPLVDAGAEALLARRPEAVALARAVGLGGDLVAPATTRAAVASRGELHPVPRGTVMGVPGDPASLAGLLTPEEVARAADERPSPPVAEDVDVAGWVSARLGPAVVDRLVEPLLGGVYAGRASRLSLRAALPALWPAARDGSPLLAAVAAAAAPLRAPGASGGHPAPGTAAGGGVFAGVRGGVARLAPATAAALAAAGGRVHLGTRATALRRVGGTWRVATGGAGGDQELAADAVVLALPPGPASGLLADPVPAAAAELGAVEVAGFALVTLLLPRGALDALVDEDGLALSGLLVPPAEGRLVKAMTASSRKWAWVGEAAGGREVLRLSVGRRGEEGVLARPDDELVAAAVADAADLLRLPLQPLSSVLTRWPGALPQPDVGHVGRVARVRAAVAAAGGLALAGAALDGVGVPACIAAASRAAGEVLEQLAA